MDAIRINAHYYQQFDADYALDVPAEAYPGWQQAEVEISRSHTALVVMHAWDVGSYERFPGQWRACDWVPRANEICRTVFPPLLEAVRESPFRLYHVVGGRDYYSQYAGSRIARELAGPTAPPPERIASDPILDRLHAFRSEHSAYGLHNEADIAASREYRRFPKEAVPVGEEGVAENAEQLFALCKRDDVNHLVYAGFNINWCLLLSPGGMLDMTKRGFMCSAIREAVTAVENRETARSEQCKELGLWRVARSYGFVFDVADFIAACKVTAVE